MSKIFSEIKETIDYNEEIIITSYFINSRLIIFLLAKYRKS